MNAKVDMQVENERRFAELAARPRFAWPTFLLFVFNVTLAIASTYAALTGALAYGWAIFFNTIASYAAYSVVHEASHGLISFNRPLNDWIGRISLAMVSVVPFFRTYRFLHITHHRFANDPEKDPDYFCGEGPKWALPIRWNVMDYAYVRLYMKPGVYSSRPLIEKVDYWLSFVFGAAVLALVTWQGWWMEFLLLYFLPTRIALFILAITFDYLPHYPHAYTMEQNKNRATNNRVGWEWLISPLLIGHNYHLSHHLYPGVPFYRYRKVWEARKALPEHRDAAVVQAFRLKPDEPAPAAVR